MRRKILSHLIFAYFVASSGVATCADDKVEFFKQFLDQSPDTNVRASNLSQSWLRKVVQDAPTRLVNPLTRDVRDSDELPVLLAVQQQAAQSMQPAEAAKPDNLVRVLPSPAVAGRPLTEPVRPLQLPRSTYGFAGAQQPQYEFQGRTTQAPYPRATETSTETEPLALSLQAPTDLPIALEAKRRLPRGTRIAQPVPPTDRRAQQPTRSQPEPPIAEPAPPLAESTSETIELPENATIVELPADEQMEAEAVLKAEQQVTKRVDSLQSQLEAEEKRLESQLALYAKKRNAALEKNDEQSLERIEKSEQTAVANYERRVKRLLSASLPKDPSELATIPKQKAPQQQAAPKGLAASNRPRVSPRQPVEKPVAKERAGVLAGPTWLQKKLKSKLNPASKTTTKQAPKATNSNRPPAKYRLVSPEELRKAKAAQEARAKAQQKQSPAKPTKKKRFKLWPFR